MLPTPTVGDEADWVRVHLSHLLSPSGGTTIAGSPSHPGGQGAADRALESFDVTGYAANRSVVEPVRGRGASGLSPWIRHGLLDLPRVWDHVSGGPERDVATFRDELLWQEYARHLYARLGTATRRAVRGGHADRDHGGDRQPDRDRDLRDGWARLDPAMACTGDQVDALVRDGWITNRGRLWLASDWAVRRGLDWAAGEDLMFRSLLDGSRAANRLGWQWTSGAGSARPWAFAREQVERLAPGRCSGCELRHACPIESADGSGPSGVTATGDGSGLPSPPDRRPEAATDRLLRRDPDAAATAGPATVLRQGSHHPEAVWITAESLGDADPALDAHPRLPAVFVLDEPLLGRLRLGPTRLVFLAECLADLATRRTVEVHLDEPAQVLADRRLATTAAPVPGNRRLRNRIGPAVAELHPWPWLVTPHDRSVRSFSAWRRHVSLPGR